jgi:hypothetical protein
MKTYNEFEGYSAEDIMGAFKQPFDPEIKILIADYSYENYSGNAFVLFEQNGQLFEVHGSHCSCYGLENQWDADLTSREDIRRRLARGAFSDAIYLDDLKALCAKPLNKEV